MTPQGAYDIDALLDDVVTLPSMPDSLAHITELINDPDCPLSEVANAIASDPAIAMKTLRLVNSAFYGLGQQVTTLNHAVVLLGVRVIRNLALTATVFDTMENSADRFLHHCVACGVAMRVLQEAGPLGDRVATADEAFIYGLFHDIGKVILEEHLPEECEEAAEAVREKQIPWYRAEREAIGVDHGAVGARLAEKWKLAPGVVAAIQGHHDLSACAEEDRLLAASLGCADYLCSLSGVPAHEEFFFDLDESVWEAAELDHAALLGLVDRYFDSFHMVHELIRDTGEASE